MNKSAACRFAAGDYVGAFTEMEEALLLAREELVSLDDYRQLAEILNNLGCLSYIGGKVDRAAMYFNESLSVHTKVTSKSMYLGSRFSSHTAILNASITKANLGFLLLVTQKPAESVSKLEESLRVSGELCTDKESNTLPGSRNSTVWSACYDHINNGPLDSGKSFSWKKKISVRGMLPNQINFAQIRPHDVLSDVEKSI